MSDADDTLDSWDKKVWTVERIEVLKKMWGEGQSANSIVEALGFLSRSAVISKVHRLGLKHHVSSTTAEPITDSVRHTNEPLDLLLRTAEQGDAEAQFKYGVALSEGQYGCVRNIVEATVWFRDAADQDHMEAKLHLARAYRNGVGLEVDIKLALHYLRRQQFKAVLRRIMISLIYMNGDWEGKKI